MFDVFGITNSASFEQKALELYRLHADQNPVYKSYINYLNRHNVSVQSLKDIPFLPISFFKTHKILLEGYMPKRQFLSSGTTLQSRSVHHLVSEDLYIESFMRGFNHFFGSIEDYVILALLPSYLRQGQSSLVYMADHWIKQSQHPESGFYLDNYKALVETLTSLEKRGQKSLLLGVSYALLDLIDYQRMQLNHTLIMETGGMKGRRRELIKKDLHNLLKEGFGVSTVYSEYGMTELLSQAYSQGAERYKTVPWMKVLIREVEDPFSYLPTGKSGGINIIDLANYYSCPFIETQDLGKCHPDNSFEVLGRFDFSDIRGCNLMIT